MKPAYPGIRGTTGLVLSTLCPISGLSGFPALGSRPFLTVLRNAESYAQQFSQAASGCKRLQKYGWHSITRNCDANQTVQAFSRSVSPLPPPSSRTSSRKCASLSRASAQHIQGGFSAPAGSSCTSSRTRRRPSWDDPVVGAAPAASGALADPRAHAGGLSDLTWWLQPSPFSARLGS